MYFSEFASHDFSLEFGETHIGEVAAYSKNGTPITSAEIDQRPNIASLRGSVS